MARINGLIKGIHDGRCYIPKQTACSYHVLTPFHLTFVLAADLGENTADTDKRKLQ